jgi:hypothetical protein
VDGRIGAGSSHGNVELIMPWRARGASLVLAHTRSCHALTLALHARGRCRCCHEVTGHGLTGRSAPSASATFPSLRPSAPRDGREREERLFVAAVAVWELSVVAVDSLAKATRKMRSRPPHRPSAPAHYWPTAPYPAPAAVAIVWRCLALLLRECAPPLPRQGGREGASEPPRRGGRSGSAASPRRHPPLRRLCPAWGVRDVDDCDDESAEPLVCKLLLATERRRMSACTHVGCKEPPKLP